ncbi:integral membrane protein [Coniochaeta sp. PMI_546]|nr:integral membrane protein [Coniochaeta sp. PMI_546]
MQGLKGYNPDNLQPWTVQVVTSVTVLAAVCVGLRLFSRHLKGQKLWWDDYLIMFSMAWNLMVVGFIFAMYSSGMGIHADKVPMDDIVQMAKFLVVAEVLYVYNLVWTKISILLMYYRIFHFPYFKKWAYGIGAFIIIWVITITFLFIFICVPVEKLWYPDLPGHCINQVGTWIANAASTIISDLVILLLPLPQVWSLQLRVTEKIAVTLAFCLGFFVVFASAYRFSVLFSYSGLDPTYTLAPTVGWTAIEMSAGIVSACLPTMRPVIQWAARGVGIKGGIFGSSTHDSAAFSKNLNQSGNRLRSNADQADADFYRLPDDNASGKSREQLAADATLRPDHGFAYAVTSKPAHVKNDKDSLSSGDEIPLQGIRVHTDFKHSG